MKLSTATRIFITLDGDDFSDGQAIDMIHELCILVDQGKEVQEAFDKICEVYGIVLPTNEKNKNENSAGNFNSVSINGVKHIDRLV